MAKEMGIDRAFAINRRRHYLTERLMQMDDVEEDFVLGFDSMCQNEMATYLVGTEIIAFAKEQTAINKELAIIKKMNTDPVGITDDMIEEARKYPIEKLIDFNRKKARAWCHEDKTPSLVHLDRINKAWCPVCDKKFGPIDFLREQGMSFPDAVKQLCGRY
jgi:hypothetical protein